MLPKNWTFLFAHFIFTFACMISELKISFTYQIKRWTGYRNSSFDLIFRCFELNVFEIHFHVFFTKDFL